MIYGLILLVIALLNIFLGFFVLSRGADKEAYRTFCLWVICPFLWNIMDFGLFFAKDPQFAINWAKILLIGVIFIPSTFLHFVIAFLKESGNWRRKLIPFGYIISLIFGILSILGFVITDVTPIKRGYSPPLCRNTYPSNFPLIFLRFYLIWGLVTCRKI